MRDLLLSLGAAQWVLPAMLFWPIVAAIAVRAIGRDAARDDAGGEAPAEGLDARALTVGALAVEAALGLVLWSIYNVETPSWQARVDLPWLTDLGATISLGVDGLSMPMVVLTSILMPLTLLGAWSNVRVRTPSFGALVLLLTSGLIGVLISLDLLLFYLAWELMLIPTYFIIGIWGSGRAVRASLRYVLFTLVGSLLMLVAILSLWNLGGGTSFQFDHLLQVRLTDSQQLVMFGAFFMAFAVKSALVPFHSWLPDAQSSAPTFAAVTLGLKVGIYAILRFAIPLFPAAATDPRVRDGIMVVSVVAILYGAFLAMSQRDIKRLISYSSISHLGFIMLGAFVLTQQSVEGSVMIMVNHGITTSALFLLAGMLQDRRGSTTMSDFGGIARRAPWYSVMFVLAVLSTVGLPGTNGFVGEFLVLLGTYAVRPALATIATVGVILAAIYGLRSVQQVLFEPANDSNAAPLRDLSMRERAVMGVFAVGIVWLGLAPSVVLTRVERASRGVIESARFGPNAPTSRMTLSVNR